MDNEKLIANAVKELKSIPQVNAALVFGSTARGTRKPYSDIDIAVILDQKADKQAEAEAGACHSTIVDITLFHRLSPLMQHKVLQEGKPVFERRQGTLRALRTRVNHVYLDYLPMYKRFGLA